MQRTLLLSTSLVPLCLAAQPTYTASDGSTTVGQSITLFTCDWAEPGPGGPAHVWDFSSIQIGASGTSQVLAPAATPYGNLFPGANRAWLTGTSYGYWNEGANQNSLVGYYANDAALPYSDPEKTAQYPITSTSSWTDPFFGTTAVVSGAFTQRQGTYSAVVDGYGTLLLPSGTYTDVLRMHYHESYRDVSYYGSTEISRILYETDNYAWIKPGFDQSLLAMLTASVSYVFGEDTLAYPAQLFGRVCSQVVGIEEASQDAFGLTLYPDPATSFAHVGFSAADPGRTTIDVLDLSGAVVRPAWSGMVPQGPQVHQLDLTGLAPGLYAVRVTQEGKGTVTKRLMVQ